MEPNETQAKRRGIARILFGSATGWAMVVRFVVICALSVAIPVLIVLWVVHATPPDTSTSNTAIAFCPTLDTVTSTLNHISPTSEKKAQQEFKSVAQLLAKSSPPSAVAGAVTNTESAVRSILALSIALASGTATSRQEQRGANLESKLTQDLAVLSSWGKENCH
jgi:hypothetical protein